jgi:two-component system chemotaxis sensor kinase CheA
LLQLINDILDLSKVEAGRLEILHEEVSVHEFPDLMQVQFQHIKNEKNIDFQIKIEPTVPYVVYSDANRIGQILRNLLANAFKFTSTGVVSLSIEMEKDGKDSIDGSIVSNVNNKAVNWIIFHVIDSGIGVPEDKRKLIFEPFQQADGSISRRFGGTGLGLPISCNLARLLGGCIRYSNRSEGGSVFSFYLPAYTTPQGG